MLLSIRGFVESARALAGWVPLQLDRAHARPDESERARADAFVALLTPVVKSAYTDLGFESAVTAQQVFGGHGYIREWGMEQFVRDARIAQIYEGTNGVQAMDLVGRKLSLAGGAVVADFLDLVGAELAEARTSGAADDVSRPAEEILALLRTATAQLQGADADTVGAAATEYLRLFALTCFGWMWSRMDAVAAKGDTLFHQAKRDLARFYAARVLPQGRSLAAIIATGPGPIMTLEADSF
jgi:hypothetical protein